MAGDVSTKGTVEYIQVRKDDWDNVNRALRQMWDSVDALSGQRGNAPRGSDLNLNSHRAINAADPTDDTDLVTKQYADAHYGPTVIQQQLSITGDNPLLPVPLLGQGAPIELADTHANRPSAMSYGIGSLYFETDRTVEYINLFNTSLVQVWVYKSGVYRAPLASQPADLGVNDVGFRFVASDTAQHFKWSGSAFTEEQELSDASAASAPSLLNLIHRSSGTPATGFGAGLDYYLDSAAKTKRQAAEIVAAWAVATDGSETTSIFVKLRSAGAALASFFEILITGIRFSVGGVFGKLTHANASDRTYTFADADGNIVYQTADLPDNDFVLGGGGAKVKDSTFTEVPVAKGGTGSTTAAGALSNLGAAAAQAPGAHTITLEKITPGGTTGSISWAADGVIAAYVDPT